MISCGFRGIVSQAAFFRHHGVNRRGQNNITTDALGFENCGGFFGNKGLTDNINAKCQCPLIVANIALGVRRTENTGSDDDLVDAAIGVNCVFQHGTHRQTIGDIAGNTDRLTTARQTAASDADTGAA